MRSEGYSGVIGVWLADSAEDGLAADVDDGVTVELGTGLKFIGGAFGFGAVRNGV